MLSCAKMRTSLVCYGVVTKHVFIGLASTRGKSLIVGNEFPWVPKYHGTEIFQGFENSKKMCFLCVAVWTPKQVIHVGQQVP